jgi:hypothetical protein
MSAARIIAGTSSQSKRQSGFVTLLADGTGVVREQSITP